MSVCLSHAAVSKQLNVSSIFFIVGYSHTILVVFSTKLYGNIIMGTLLTGASNAMGMKKSQFSANISLYTIAYKMAIIGPTMECE